MVYHKITCSINSLSNSIDAITMHLFNDRFLALKLRYISNRCLRVLLFINALNLYEEVLVA